MDTDDRYRIEVLKTKDGIDIPALYKNASERDMRPYLEVQAAMKRIYEENPGYWPHGLSIAGHDAVYAVREVGTEKVAGFVGWQERVENGRRIGSYSIGILPEYRQRGFAKEAVAKVLQLKAASVDEVRAYVMPGNTPSEGLAGALRLDVFNEF